MIVIKKLWLLLFLCAFALAGGGWYLFFGAEMNDAGPQYIMQTITEDSMRSRTITWQANQSDLVQSLVYYAEKDGKQKSLSVKPRVLTTGAEAMSLYSVTIENLKPGTVYFYKVGSESIWSDWYSLKTESAGQPTVKAIVFGDSQSENYDVWQKTAQQAWQSNGDADFFINMGDLVDIGSHYDQWKSWVNGAANMIQRIPVAPVSGNHENYLPGGTFSPAYLYQEIFHLPQNGPESLKGQAYSFDYGNIHFVVLDSQQEELAEFQPDLISEQVAWLKQDLAKTEQPWKVILIHRPLFNNEAVGTLNDLGTALMPLFDRHQVDVVFSAHIHTYGRSRPMQVKNPAKNAPQGTVYLSTGRSGDKIWEESKQKQFESVFDRCLDQPNYLVVECRDNWLTVTNFKQDGSVVDTVTMKK